MATDFSTDDVRQLYVGFDATEEALSKVRLKIAFAPPFGRGWGGRSYNCNKHGLCGGLSADLFWLICS